MDISRRTLERLDRPGRGLIEADLTRPLTGRSTLRRRPGPRRDRAPRRRRAAVAPARGTGPSRGHVVVSVPALPELFTEFDAIQGHRRRYLPRGSSGLRRTGLELERSSGGAVAGADAPTAAGRPARRPGIAAEGYRRYLRLPPWPLALVARLAFAVERRPRDPGTPAIGTSLFAVARRPAGPG